MVSSSVSGLLASSATTTRRPAIRLLRRGASGLVAKHQAAVRFSSIDLGSAANRFTSSLTSSSSSAFNRHFSAYPRRPVYQITLNTMERPTNKDSVGSLSSCASSGNSGGGGVKNCKTPFMIGVAGGTASGKTTVCEKIMEAVISNSSSSSSSSDNEGGGPTTSTGSGSSSEKNIVAISEDSFYRELDEKESLQAQRGMFNFDHPDAFDLNTMMKCLADIRDGKVTKVPEYDFKTNSRLRDSDGKEVFRLVYPSDVVLLEGILVFYHKDVRELFDMKLFVDTDADTRLSRRVLRDIEHRGRDLEHVLHQYTTLVKPAFEEFCLPTKKFADVIIPRGADNTVAISLVAQHIEDIIWRRNGGCDCSSTKGVGGNGTPLPGAGGARGGSPSFTRSRSSSDSLVR